MTYPCLPGEKERSGVGTEVPVLVQARESEMSMQGKHHTMNGEECFRIITLSREVDSALSGRWPYWIST